VVLDAKSVSFVMSDLVWEYIELSFVNRQTICLLKMH